MLWWGTQGGTRNKLIEADEFYELFEALELTWNLDEEKTLGPAYDPGDFYQQEWLNAARGRECAVPALLCVGNRQPQADSGTSRSALRLTYCQRLLNESPQLRARYARVICAGLPSHVSALSRPTADIVCVVRGTSELRPNCI